MLVEGLEGSGVVGCEYVLVFLATAMCVMCAVMVDGGDILAVVSARWLSASIFTVRGKSC